MLDNLNGEFEELNEEELEETVEGGAASVVMDGGRIIFMRRNK